MDILCFSFVFFQFFGFFDDLSSSFYFLPSLQQPNPEIIIGSGESSSSSDSAHSSPEDSPLDARKSIANPSNVAMPAINGSRSAVLPDLLPKTSSADRALASHAFIKEHPSSVSIESQCVEEVSIKKAVFGF